MNSQVHTELPVVFEDVQFHRVTNIPKEGMYRIVHHASSALVIKNIFPDNG